MMTLDKFYSEYDQSDIEWMNKRRAEWMTDNQWICYLFLNRLFKGFHHIPTEPKKHGNGIKINFRPSYMATYDFDTLTKMVIMSHNWGVRVEIKGSGPSMIKLILHKRHKREGDIAERIETIDQMVDKYRDF